MSETLPVRLRLGPTGSDPNHLIEIGGLDVTRFVTRIEFTSDPSSMAVLRLEFIKVEVDAETVIDVTAMGDGYQHFIEASAAAIDKHLATKASSKGLKEGA